MLDRRTLRLQDRICDSALCSVLSIISKWTVCDFLKHYNTIQPLFYSDDIDEFVNTYLTVDTSMCRILELLLFQYRSSIKVKEFLRELCLVCDKNNGKLNSIQSNAGKTQFGDTLTAFFLNRGSMSNPSRSERFCFQECANRRIIFWDEAKLDPGFYDNIKKLLSGDQCKVPVKFKEDQIVKQTPVIVCSNNDIFPKNDEFYNRIISYRWYKYPLWRKSEINKKLHPVAIGLLMAWGNDDVTFDYSNLRKQFIVAKEYVIKHGLF